MVDFEMVFIDGKPAMTYNRVDSIVNNMYLSISIKKGSFIFAPLLGSRLYKIRKITDNNIRLASDYVSECLKWMVIAKRLYNLSVVAERDESDLNRINISVAAKKQNGQDVEFKTFYRVV